MKYMHARFTTVNCNGAQGTSATCDGEDRQDQVGREKTCGRGLAARTYEDRNLGVVYDVVADAAEERASNGVQTARTHHDQMSFLCLRYVDDALAGVLARRLTAHLVPYLHQSHTHKHTH